MGMRNDSNQGKVFTRRALVLMGMKLTLLTSLIARLYYLQIIKVTEYKTLSDSNRIRLSIIPPLRGNIYDRFDTEIATNENYYRILFDPGQASDMTQTLTRLSNILGFSFEEQEKFIARAKKKYKERRGAVLVHDHLTWEQVARVEVNTPDLPGVLIDVAQVRHYPFAEKMCHVLGYVDNVSKEEGDTNNPLLMHPDFKIGKNSIERTFESVLRGQAGVKKLEVNAFGLPVRELSREESSPGSKLHLTIDAGLQEIAYARLSEKGGAAAVMDLTNGDILTLCSTPGFDPNQFAYGISSEYWGSLINSPYKPLTNKAVSQQYPPGSTFKLVVALAALKAHVNPENKVYCPGYFRLGSRRFHCWKEQGHGHVNLREAISGSCNTYFFTIAQKIGIEAIAEMAQEFGLGEKTGIPISNEVAGIVPSPTWKQKTYKQPWQAGDTLNAGIGQGFMVATPLQMALMVARLGARKKVVPRLVLDDPNNRLPVSFESMGIPDQHINLVIDGMDGVVNRPGGTAYMSRIPEKEFAMAGKTGTSQVVARSVNEDKRKEDIAWKNKNHALFVAIAPVDNPRYAISVVIEHGGSGSGAAAPVARDIMRAAQARESARNPTILEVTPAAMPVKKEEERV
ncbi:MAG: ftsI [Rickettsiales bacterium]|jgi:penicillin-binding protein 2|nr:ftsI [Rickettsiales bacterium]